MTLPLAPLSLPATTRTVSPFLIFMLEHLRRQRDDLHELLVPQFPAYRAKNTSTAWLSVVLNKHCGVLIKSDVGTIRPAALFHGADNDGFDYVALFHTGTRN